MKLVMNIMRSMIGQGYTKDVILREWAQLHASATDAIVQAVLLIFKKENGEKQMHAIKSY